MRPTINPTFRDLIPPLAADERAALEGEIVAHGCREPLVVWRGMLIDGHNRLEICERLDLPYTTVDYTDSILLSDEGSVMRWICDNQLARRNLTPFQGSYLRGKRYLIERERRVHLGQNGPRGDDGRLKNREQPLGDARALVASEHGVGARTVSRDAQYASDIDAIAESAGLGVRNAVLRGELRITRKAVHQVAERRPVSLEQLRAVVMELRTTRPSARAEVAHVAAFSTRGIRELIYEGEGKERQVVAALLSCGHRVRYRPRSSSSRTKSMPCPKCGSGSRPAWERQVRRVALEAAVRTAAADPRRFAHLVDLVAGSIDVLTVAPMTEQQLEIWGKVERGIYGARVVEAPVGAL